MVDDLRPEIGALGASHVRSPRIDDLAARGVLFRQAYVQVPVCGASRASMLTGLRPTHRRFISFDTRVDRDVPGTPTLADLLRGAGYTTIANGKILHWDDDDLDGWSEPPWRVAPGGADQTAYVLPENQRLVSENGRGPAYEAAEVDDFAYPNGKVAEKSIADLRRLARDGSPFLLAVGFWKPHLPFNAPQRYWDLYDRAQIPLARDRARPEGAPDAALHASPELRTQYLGIPPAPQPIDGELARTLTHGYLAAVSYTDALIGRVLDALEELHLADDTIVVLTGDHGFLLGDHAMWTKHASFDVTLRTPLVIRAPGAARGAATDEIVESLDLLPTLLELTGVAPPPDLAGTSLTPLLDDPHTPGKGFAISQWTSAISLDPGPWFGESIRTGRWLYTEWRDRDGSLHARMLYDHQSDPGETVNVAESTDPAIVDALSIQLRAITGTAAQSSAEAGA
ncbi:sulfatase [Candidatus Binatia bacterium]|nr:sulfatase [Candidatus Binatia bacterium]